MFDYKFITIKATSFKRKPKEDYHKLIEEHARSGWRFVQIFAPGIFGYGNPGYYELIFEKHQPV